MNWWMLLWPMADMSLTFILDNICEVKEMQGHGGYRRVPARRVNIVDHASRSGLTRRNGESMARGYGEDCIVA